MAKGMQLALYAVLLRIVVCSLLMFLLVTPSSGKELMMTSEKDEWSTMAPPTASNSTELVVLAKEIYQKMCKPEYERGLREGAAIGAIVVALCLVRCCAGAIVVAHMVGKPSVSIQQQPEDAVRSNTMAVQIPAGSTAGQQLQVQGPNGMFTFTVPQEAHMRTEPQIHQVVVPPANPCLLTQSVQSKPSVVNATPIGSSDMHV